MQLVDVYVEVAKERFYIGQADITSRTSLYQGLWMICNMVRRSDLPGTLCLHGLDSGRNGMTCVAEYSEEALRNNSFGSMAEPFDIIVSWSPMKIKNWYQLEYTN